MYSLCLKASRYQGKKEKTVEEVGMKKLLAGGMQSWVTRAKSVGDGFQQT